MPLAYTPQQKAAIAEFASITAVKDSAAAKWLKAFNWNLEQAIDSHFQKTGASRPTPANLGKIFDEYRGKYPPTQSSCADRVDTPESPDTIGTDGTVKYLGAIGVALDEPVMLSVLAQVDAPTMGELSRTGFVNGWDKINASTLAEQKRAADDMRRRLKTDADLFRGTYKHTFLLARQPGQKAVMLDIAPEFWKMLFGQTGMYWHGDAGATSAGRGVDWLSLWIEFLESEWKKSISRDLWNQTYEFAKQTLADGSLSWYTEDASWPAVVDDFVSWLTKKGIVTPPEQMETDE